MEPGFSFCNTGHCSAPFPLSEATGWETLVSKRHGQNPKNLRPFPALVTLPPEGLSPEGSSTRVTAPVGPGWLRASREGKGGWWVGRELLWGLLQSIVCSSVFVCQSLRRELLKGEVRLVGRKGERGLSLSGRDWEEGRQGDGSAFNLLILSHSNSWAVSPREFQALLILGPGQQLHTKALLFLLCEILAPQWRPTPLPCPVCKKRLPRGLTQTYKAGSSIAFPFHATTTLTPPRACLCPCSSLPHQIPQAPSPPHAISSRFIP